MQVPLRYSRGALRDCSGCGWRGLSTFAIVYLTTELPYLPNTFFTSPTFRSTLPAIFSVVPRSSKLGLPTAFPVSSFTFPATSFAVPFTLSVVLEFMLLIRRRSGFGLSRLCDGIQPRFFPVCCDRALLSTASVLINFWAFISLPSGEPEKLETQRRLGRRSRATEHPSCSEGKVVRSSCALPPTMAGEFLLVLSGGKSSSSFWFLARL